MTVTSAERVDIEVDGVTYQASYIVQEGVVTVEYEGEEKSTQADNQSADIVACNLLYEIVHEHSEWYRVFCAMEAALAKIE